MKISCSTSPHYFSLDETNIKKWRTFAKLSPPLRDKKNVADVKLGILNNVITCITSDHSPHDTDSKRLPFEIASPGSIGFESLLPLTLNLIRDKKGIQKLDKKCKPYKIKRESIINNLANQFKKHINIESLLN